VRQHQRALVGHALLRRAIRAELGSKPGSVIGRELDLDDPRQGSGGLGPRGRVDLEDFAPVAHRFDRVSRSFRGLRQLARGLVALPGRHAGIETLEALLGVLEAPQRQIDLRHPALGALGVRVEREASGQLGIGLPGLGEVSVGLQALAALVERRGGLGILGFDRSYLVTRRSRRRLSWRGSWGRGLEDVRLRLLVGSLGLDLRVGAGAEERRGEQTAQSHGDRL